MLAGGDRAVQHTRRLLARLDQIILTTELLDSAAALAPSRELRSLDAIHLATARLVGEELRAVVTYDQRMADAAVDLGLAVEMPT